MTSLSFIKSSSRFHNVLRVFKQKKIFCTQVQPKIEPEISNNDQTDTLKHPDYFHVHDIFTVKDLFDARVHYGHKEGTLNNKMLPYIYGSRLGHVIFDLDITAVHLRQALNFIAHIAYRGGVILFINRYFQNSYYTEKLAMECGEFAHTRHWKRGLFTNSSEMYGTTTRLPDLCIFFNTLSPVLQQHLGVVDCAKLLIPTIGIVDSNCDPNLITYPIPGNDDSPASIQYFGKIFKEAIRRGKEEREKVFKENK